MGVNRRRRIATAKWYTQRHLLRRLREAGHGLSTDLNLAYELIYAVGVEKHGGEQSRLQMIPGEARVVEQQVGGMSGLHTTPMASNEVNSIQSSFSGSDARSRRLPVLMWINCVTPEAGASCVEPSLVDISRWRVVIRHAFCHQAGRCWWVKVPVRLLVGIRTTTRDWPMRPFPQANPSFLQAYLQQD